MEGNIGWKYNKAYYYNLQGDPSNGNLLKKQNDELLDTIYDDSLLKQLLDVWKNVIAKDKNIFQVELTTSYPGLITGIGVNHQTTLEWMDQTAEKPDQIPEFKLGITFDHTTGLPIIPGSSIKGVLRSFFPVMNQNKFCDCYEEKINYIAAIIHKVSQLVSCLKNKEIEERFLKKLFLNEYLSKENQLKEKLLESLEKDREKEISGMIDKNEISDEEFDGLCTPQALKTFAEERLKAMISLTDAELEPIFNSFAEDIIGSRYQPLNKEEKKKRKKNLYDTILNRPLEDEETDNEDRAKASCLALEMFEGKKKNGEYIPIYQRDTFFDAIPVSGDSNADGELFAKDFITPHKKQFENPEPICFMKIRSNVRFRFYFSLHDGVISKEEKLLLIKYLLFQNGLGAKTNVGYGQFNFSKEEMLRITQQREE